MQIDLLVTEMVQIDETGKRPSSSHYFTQTSLTERNLASAVRLLLSWLRAAAISSRNRSLQLDPSSIPGRSCIQLVEENARLSSVFVIENYHLNFSKDIPEETRSTK